MSCEEHVANKLTSVALLTLDVVDSSNLEQSYGREEARVCMERVRDVVGQAFEDYGASSGGESWQGDGVCAYFTGDGAAGRAVRSALRAVEMVRTLPRFDVQVRVAVGIIDEIPIQERLGEITSSEFNFTGHIAGKDVCPPNGVCISESVFISLSATDGDLARLFSFRGITTRDGKAVFSWPSAKKPTVPGGLREEGARLYDVWQSLVRYYRTPPFSSLRFYCIPQLDFVGSLDLGNAYTPLKVRGSQFVEKLLSDGRTAWRLGTDKLPAFLGRDREELSAGSQQQESSPEEFGVVFWRHRVVVVLGDPGSGKTTLLRWLAWVTAGGREETGKRLGVRENLLPVYAPVARLLSVRREQGDSCLDLLVGCLHADTNKDEAVLREALEHRLDQQELLLLFDGLDELSSAADRNAAASLVSSLVTSYPGNRVVVTSRLVGYPGFPAPGAEAVVLEPPSNEQARELARAFCSEFFRANRFSDDEAQQQGKKEADTLIHALSTRPGLSVFMRSPLLLSLAGLVHVQLGELPRFRIKLYDVAIRTLSSAWSKARGAVWDRSESCPRPLDYELEILRVLPALAFRMHSTGPGGRIPEKDLIIELAALLPTQHGEPGLSAEREKRAREFLDRLGASSPIFAQVGTGEWGFLHLTFQEYLAAKHLAMTDGWEEVARNHRYSPWWREVMQFLAAELGVIQGRIPAASKFIRHIFDDTRDFPPEDLRLAPMLATQCLVGTIVDNEIELRVLTGISSLLASGADVLSDRWIRETFRHFQRTPRGSFLAGLLMGQLWASSGGLNEKVLVALEAIGYRDDLPDILAILTDEKGEGGRRIASCKVIERVGTRAAVRSLVGIVDNNTQDSKLRAAATAALGGIRADEEIPWLIILLTNRVENLDVRIAAAGALAAMGLSEPTIALLRELLFNKHEPSGLRETILLSLGPKEGMNSFAELLAMVCDKEEDDSLRTSAIVLLVAACPNEMRGQISRIVNNEQDGGFFFFVLLIVLIAYISVTNSEEAKAEILDRVVDRQEQNDVRGMIAGLLAFPFAVSTLLHVYRDMTEVREVRLPAMVALGRMGIIEVEQEVIDVVANKQEPVSIRKMCLECIGKIRSKNALPIVRDVLHDPRSDSTLLKEAIDVLAVLGDATVASDLKKIVEDKEKPLSIRLAAWNAYCQIEG